MKIFTFNDSFRNQINRTKQRIGLFSLLFLFLGLGSYAQDSCEISVTVSSAGYGEVTSWQLLDGSNQIVLSGGNYSTYGYSDNKTYIAINPPYSLKIMTTNYCYNTPSYSVTVGGQQDISGMITECGPINLTIPLNTDLTSCIPSCPVISQSMTNGISPNSADLEWVSEGNLFDLEWGEIGFTLGEGNMITNINETSYNLTGLNSETNYQYYIRRNCGNNDYSFWSEPYTFYTGYCLASSTPNNAQFNSRIIDFFTSGGYTNISNTNNGTDNTYSNFTNYNVKQSAGESFDYTVFPWGGAYIDIWVDWNNNFLFEENELVAQHAYGNTTFTGSILIPNNILEGEYRMRVRSRSYYDLSASPCGNTLGGETEDYIISVIPIPSCLPPSNLTMEVTSNSAYLSWTSEGTLFELEWGENGFTPGVGEGIIITGITDTSHTITGLAPEKNYQYYIRQDCGNGSFSYWTGSNPFYVGYCSVSATFDFSADGKITSFYTSGGYINISNLDNGTDGIYNNFSNYSVAQQPGGAFDYGISVPYTTYVTFWVDWNNNLIFEESELIAEHNEYEWEDTTFTGTINIPAGTPEGEYRMRIRSRLEDWSGEEGVTTPACGEVFAGETEDYSIFVTTSGSEVFCLPPLNPTVNTVSYVSAELSWTSEGTLFEIEYGENGFIPGTGESIIVTDITNTSYTLTEINSETHYQYYVRQKCGDNHFSVWSEPYSFYTGYCLASSEANVYEGTIIGFYTSGGVTNILNPDNGFDNGYSNFTNYSLTQLAGESFDYEVKTSIPGYTNVAIWVDWNSNMIFEEDELVAQPDVNGWIIGTIDIPENILEGSYRMRIRSNYYGDGVMNPCGDFNTGETEDYTLSVISTPSCSPPLDFSENITFTSAELFWTGEGTSFDLEWGESGFIPGTGEGTVITNITSTSYLLTELNPETNYQYYIRQNCEGDFSLWSGPNSFYTGYCLVSSFWNNEGYGILSFMTSFAYTNIINPNNGADSAYSNFSNYSVIQSAGGSFDYAVSVPQGFMNIDIWIDWNKNFLFEEDELVAHNDSNSSAGGVHIETGTIIIPEGIAVGDYRMRIRSVEDYTIVAPCGYLGAGETEDYTVSVVPLPSCFTPSGLAVGEISYTTAAISWISDGNLFEVKYGEEGFVPENGGTTETGITGTSHTLTGLESETHYEYYVRQDCGGNDLSPWIGPYPFYTGYCLVSSYYTGEQINSFFTTGGIVDNISNSSGLLPNGYGNFTNQSVNHFETGTVNFTVTTSSQYLSANIWIDWNNNLMFEENEKVLTSNAGSTIHTGNIIVPLGTPIGSYRIRIKAQYDNYDDNSSTCGAILWGETEDYTFTVITPPSCLTPYLLASTNISSTSVLLEWESNGNLFDVEYGLEGFTLGEGTLISEIENNYILSGLTSSETYQYYVRQNCGNSDYSIWVGPIIFTPEFYEGNIPTLLNTNPQVDDLVCAYESISIEVPEGQYLSALNVKYSMISHSGAWTSQQRSVLYSSTLGMGEEFVVAGETDFPGVINYNRNITFANGGTGTIEFELKAWRTQGGTGCGTNHIYVMDGSWILLPTFLPIPTCPAPTGLDITNITENSVDITWTDNEDSLFDLQWGVTGFNQNTEGILVTELTNNFYTISDINSSNTYEFYVRRNCSSEEGEDYSVWTGPFKFNSGYCIPTSAQAYYFTLFNTTNAIENISFSYPSGSPLGTGYKNETDMIVSQEAGSSFNFSANYIGGASGFKIWIDWNNNFVFEDNEQVFYQGSTTGNKTGSITIPSEIEPGNYRMRIRVQAGANSTPSACGNIDTGEAIDFTLNIPCGEIVIPIGNTIQDFEEGDTLANLDITGNNLVWYADSELSEILEETTLLVDATTYYVVSVEGNCQSDVLAVTVNEVLSTSDFTKFGFGYHPNPVSEILYLRSNTEISEVTVFNMLGQKLSLPVQSNNTQINMTELPSGNYIMNVTIEGVTKTFKIVK